MKHHVLEMVKNGLDIFKQNDHKFIRFQDYIFPGVRIEGTENLVYYIDQLN